MTQFIGQPEGIELTPELRRVAEFHGHMCPGMLIGYRAAKEGLARLGSGRSEDEELIAVVENNSCSVDAVQALTGATFGKGNLFFKDHGKQVFTFALRPSGRAVRFALKADAFGGGEVSRDERARQLLGRPIEELFTISDLTLDLPREAQIHKSLVCPSCGEQVMDTRVREVGGQKLCIPCAENKSGK